MNPAGPFFHEMRHADLSKSLAQQITICGAGALGGNLTETLARMGFERIRLVDRDRVELRNLSSQPYGRSEIGTPKARALANALYRAVQAKIEPITLELTAGNAASLLAGSELVVDTFDNSQSRAAVSDATRAAELPCLHVGFSGDGLYGSGIWEPDYRAPGQPAGDPCDYPLTRPFALIVASLAARVIGAFLHSARRTDFEFTWADARATFRAR